MKSSQFICQFAVSFDVMDYSIVVPTLNGGASWLRAASAIKAQRPGPQKTLIIDSGSVDGTVEISRNHGFEVMEIDQTEFDHGRTRQTGVDLLSETEIIVFLTQDAILLAPDAISRLVETFDNPNIGAAYGRQIAGDESSLFERHARIVNYPAGSMVKSKDSIPDLGIRTAFCSNSFSAYRRSVLMEVGGFPDRTLFAEDMLVAAKMILADYSVAYEADALCEHWHDYSITQEFRRAFDVGVLHRREHWILEKFGSAEGKGVSLILTGLCRIGSGNPLELPSAVVKYAAKVAGYMAGRAESILPTWVKHRFSMNRSFWKESG